MSKPSTLILVLGLHDLERELAASTYTHEISRAFWLTEAKKSVAKIREELDAIEAAIDEQAGKAAS